MGSFDALKPREPLFAAAGGSGGKPEQGKKSAGKASPDKVPLGKRLKERKTGGPSSMLSKALVHGGDAHGRPRKNLMIPNGLTADKAKKMYRVKGTRQEGLLKELINFQQPEAAKQLVKLGEDVKKIAGSDKRSGRYALALLVAEAVGKHFSLQNIAQTSTTKGAEGIIPYLVHWTWLKSNGFVMGDPYARIAETLGVTLSTDSTAKEKADVSRGKKRQEVYTKFQKEVLPELEAQILDRIGEELDQIARWARAKTHNELVAMRVAALRQQKAKIPNDAQHSPVRGIKYPEKSFVAYFAKELNVTDLSQESLLKKIGGLPYVPYQVISQKRKKDIANLAQQKKEAEPGRIQRKSEKEVARDKATIERQGILSPLLDTATTRRSKMEILATALGKDLKGELRNLTDRVAGLSAALKNFLVDGVAHMPPKDSRKWLDKAFVPKDFGELQQTKLDKLRRDAKDLDTRWKRLQEFIDNVIVAPIPKEILASVKLETIKLDAIDSRNVAKIISALKSAFAEIGKKERQPKTPEEHEAYLKRILPREIERCQAAMMQLDEKLAPLYKERDQLLKDEVGNAAKLRIIEKQIASDERERRSLRDRIPYMRWLINPNDKDNKITINLKDKSRPDRLKDASNSYWGKGIR